MQCGIFLLIMMALCFMLSSSYYTQNEASIICVIRPVTVLILIALTKLLFPLIASPSIMAIFQVTLGVSSCPHTTLPTLHG